MTKSITDIARECGIAFGYQPLEIFDATLERFANAIKAAHLAELTQGVEMPEPEYFSSAETDEYGEIVHHRAYTLDQCQQAVAAAVARERQRILNCYSPDDTINDYQDKIRGNL